MLPDAAGKPMIAWDFNQRQEDNGLVIDEKRLFFTRYDALHRPLEQWLAINGGSSQLVERYAYGEQLTNVTDARARNLRGQLYQHFDPSGLEHVERHDFKGNSLELRRTLASQYKAPIIDWQAGSVTAQLEAETFVQIIEYDALGRMTRLYNWHRGTGSRVAVYEPRYNARGLLESEYMVVRATRTATGYAPSAGHPRVQTIGKIAYNAKGQKELVRYGNGTLTRYDYDPETFRLIQLRTTRPGFDPTFPNLALSLKDARVLQNLHYTFDPVGNIIEIRDEAYEPAFFSNQKVDAVSRYSYDAIYRLVRATGRENYQASGAPGQLEAAPFAVQFPVTDPNTLRNYAQSYTYDPVGNILQMRHVADRGSWTRHYEYAIDSNRLLRTWEGNNTAGATQHRYDAHGNMLNLANVEAAQFIRWDYRDMIRALNLQGGGWAYYNYDAGKQRTRKVIENHTSAKQWERIYLGGLDIYRRYSGGSIVEEIESLHLFEGEQRLLLIDDVLQPSNANQPTGPLYRYQYNNHLGSACLELDHQTKIISYEEYHPYGTSAYRATNSGTEAPPKRYRYTGMERDEESGLNYHVARFCVPWLARWLSSDPRTLDSRTLIDSVNLYRYALNPLRYTDPDGRSEIVNPDNPDDFETTRKKAAEAWRSGTDARDRKIRFFTEIEKKYPFGISGEHAWEIRAKNRDIPIDDILYATDRDNDDLARLLGLISPSRWAWAFKSLVPGSGVPLDREALLTTSGVAAKIAELYLQRPGGPMPSLPSSGSAPALAVATEAKIGPAAVKVGASVVSASMQGSGGGGGGENTATTSSDTPAPALKGDPYHPDEVAKRADEWAKLQKQMATPASQARQLGFTKRIAPQRAPFKPHGQEVFTDGKNYITPDVDSHRGGVWKMFDRQGKRLGTYDANLKRIGD